MAPFSLLYVGLGGFLALVGAFCIGFDWGHTCGVTDERVARREREQRLEKAAVAYFPRRRA